MSIETKPLSPHVGLEIIGIDLELPLSDAAATAVRSAWIEAGLLLFRGGARSPEAQIRISELLGELQPAATKHMNLENNPYLMALKIDPDKAASSDIYEIDGEQRVGFIPWHWDQTFMPTIVRGAALRMVEPAARGGETGFIDAIGAYTRLPEGLKKHINDLEVVYQFSTHADHISRLGLGIPKGIRMAKEVPLSEAMKQYCQFPPTVHPLVITQRETGRKVLKYSPHHSRYILGMELHESNELLSEIASYLTDERYAYSHRWEADDVILWDNWRIIHSARGVPVGVSRHAQRTTIAGDYDLGRYLDPMLDKHKKVVSYVD